jgi:hypothetical protein
VTVTSRVAVGIVLPLLAAAGVLFLLTGSAPSPEPRDDDPYVPPRGYVCYRARSPVVIDGRLDDPAWADAPWSEPFRDIEGDRKPEPAHRTRVKMLWDDEGLYIAAELTEPHVWATLTKHDSVIFNDNDFEVFLDPDGDSHLYAELELNALNTTWDLLLTKPYKDGGHAIHAWEITGLRTAVRVDGTINDPSDTDRGWTVEIAWPWAGLKELTKWPVPPRDGDQWRINFSRVEWEHEVVGTSYRKVPKKPEANWVWSPQGAINMHLPERWGVLQFSTSAPGQTAYRPDPAGPARHLLHRIYYAQRDYYKAHDVWAKSLNQLGLAGVGGRDGIGTPVLETTSQGFVAGVTFQPPGGEAQKWFITQDARVMKQLPPERE